MHELLKLRYKVIATFPDMHFIGDVGFSLNDIFYPVFKHDKHFFNGIAVDTYPHLFKPLLWHEERSVEEMPEYVFLNDMVEKIEKVNGFKTVAEFIKYYSEECKWKVLPATCKEYNEYINPK